MALLTWKSRQFSIDELKAIVRTACLLPMRVEPPDQVQYLGTYLANPEINAKTLLVEYPYVDRHFLSEYQAYYATALREFSRKTTRLHVFSTEFTFDNLIQQLSSTTSADERICIAEALQEAYIGYHDEIITVSITEEE